jgi:hypothetical protein
LFLSMLFLSMLLPLSLFSHLVLSFALSSHISLPLACWSMTHHLRPRHLAPFQYPG